MPETPVTPVTPVLGPIMAILRSRKFIIALASLLISLVVMAIPDLAEVRGELLTLLVAFGLALIGGITIEDAAKAGRDTAALPPVSIADAVLEAVKAAMEAYFERAELAAENLAVEIIPLETEVELTPAELETIAESVRAKMAAPPAVESAG